MHETLPATSGNNTQHSSNISSSSGSGVSQPQANLYQSQDTHNDAQDYRYDASSSSSSSYVTTLAKANEAAGQVPLYAAYSTTATVDNAAAAGEAPYCLPRVLPANEFVSTLKSCGMRSPQKQPASRHGSYCDCFARAGAGAGGAAGVPHKATVAFWPALLANLGILALLLCYILMGSFIFLTIENSVGGVGDAENIDVGVAVGAVDAAAWHFTQVPQTAAAAAKPQQTVAAINAAAATTTTTTNNLLQAHRDNASRFDNNNNNSNNQAAVANALAASGHSHSSAFSAARNFGVAAAPEAETYIDSVHDKHSSASVSSAQQLPLAQAVLSNKAQLDFELQSLSLAETEAAAEGEQLELGTQDVERQRAVENIWDITVSLNILYKENWTKLAALEIAKFQDQLVKRFIMDLTLPLANEAHSSAEAAAKAATARGRNILQQDSATMQQSGQQQQQQQQNMHDEHSYQQQRFWQLQHTRQRLLQRQQRQQQQQQRSRQPFEWNFATAFLYSLTVITTVGYGTITPRTTCGRMVTIAYATLGIPLTLVYLSSVGGILAKLLRTLCTRLLCCCLCRPHSSCAGFSRQQQVSDRKCDLKLKQLQKRQQHQQTHQPPHQQQHPHQHQQQQQLLPYCYVRPPADLSGAPTDVTSGFDTLSVATTTAESRHSGGTHALSWSLVLPVALCLLLLLAYVGVGAVVMALLEHWPLMDGVYFCFMSLTTIGFCDLLPGLGRGTSASASHCVIWFCALYILSGLTLTSMCVNLLHEEILLRMRVVLKFQKVPSTEARQGKRGFYGAPP